MSLCGKLEELLICSVGNPAVILIDEFSTGIDAKMKRDMWKTLRNVAHGKAVIITTRVYMCFLTIDVTLFSLYRLNGGSISLSYESWNLS